MSVRRKGNNGRGEEVVRAFVMLPEGKFCKFVYDVNNVHVSGVGVMFRFLVIWCYDSR